MRAIRLMLLIATAATFAQAANWDGIRGDLRVYTFAPTAAVLPGLPWIASSVTEIFISSSDVSVTAFRVTLTYKNGGQNDQKQSIIAPVQEQGRDAIAAFVGVSIASITSVSITKMRDGETTELR